MNDYQVMVDPEALRAEVRDKYREVAEHPDGEFHFHTGRRLAARCGYDPAVVDAFPDVAVESFAGVANPFAPIDVHQHAIARTHEVTCRRDRNVEPISGHDDPADEARQHP